VDKNNNGFDDKKEAQISYGLAAIGIIMSLCAMFIFEEFQVAQNMFFASMILSGGRDIVSGLKMIIKG
jgi:hypothetical protein